eukprot:CAMPEP_0184365250 /NCGR_PEP_ID=MMETSP1089-20130417/147817_1 /TAXON_ID=38269 ORGANISM="Gloeochaete wittrockiana, Strain SAG46.84" /NCGR_SAMPLE_ID=MMETSP1089 /ASSEMBLY_ACC=CAM_ASM_000445 /LENGTH=45 /DNA_ID= /DNA_START= /DNA_END= /DNA_ORIENTATION=
MTKPTPTTAQIAPTIAGDIPLAPPVEDGDDDLSAESGLANNSPVV